MWFEHLKKIHEEWKTLEPSHEVPDFEKMIANDRKSSIIAAAIVYGGIVIATLVTIIALTS